MLFLTNSFVFEKAMNKQLLFVKCRFEVTLRDNFWGYVRIEVLTGNCWFSLLLYHD